MRPNSDLFEWRPFYWHLKFDHGTSAFRWPERWPFHPAKRWRSRCLIDGANILRPWCHLLLWINHLISFCQSHVRSFGCHLIDIVLFLHFCGSRSDVKREGLIPATQPHQHFLKRHDLFSHNIHTQTNHCSCLKGSKVCARPWDLFGNAALAKIQVRMPVRPPKSQFPELLRFRSRLET